MCLILISKDVHPEYKLIVAANRDEFYNRRTKKAHFWSDNQEILAGMDLEAGGTWLGVNKFGKIAMLTNYRDISNIKNNAPSRGALVADYLKNDKSAREYLNSINGKAKIFNGFNLIAGNIDSLYYLSNYSDSLIKLGRGNHGLSNHLLNTPWYKVEKGKEKLDKLVSGKDINKEDLFSLLYDDIKAPVDSLPKTGLPRDKEHDISSMFIKTTDYGSRCSTLVMVDRQNNLHFVERTYNTSSFSYFDTSYSFVV